MMDTIHAWYVDLSFEDRENPIGFVGGQGSSEVTRGERMKPLNLNRQWAVPLNYLAKKLGLNFCNIPKIKVLRTTYFSQEDNCYIVSDNSNFNYLIHHVLRKL